MATITSQKFRDAEGNQYLLSFDLNDAALMQGQVEIAVKAERLDAPQHPQELEGTATLDLERHVIIVKLPTHEPIEIPLPEGTFDDDDSNFLEDERDPVFDFLGEEGPAAALAEGLNALPVGGDPLACLLKAGITTSIGQLIQFNYEVGGEELPARRRGWRILKCLGFNSLVMLAKTSLRTLRCWAFLDV